MHWGYWENPAKIEDTLAVLDVGCGFGGTLTSLQTKWQGLNLTGLNIDARQLEVAKKHVPNATFIEGDACALPFKEALFDRVLAVECIFHFPSRLKFFQEAARVLNPSGRISLSDFIPRKQDSSKS